MEFDSDKMWNRLGSAGEFTGVQGGGGTTKAFFAGADNKDGDNAKFYAQADGNIFYDAITRILYNPVVTGSDVSYPDGVGWSPTATASDTGDDTNTDTGILIPYKRKFGENRIEVSGMARHSDSINGTIFGHENEVRLIIDGSEVDVYDVTPTSWTEFTLTADIPGSVAVGDRISVEVEIHAFINSASGAANSTTTELREDVIVQTLT